MELRCPHKLHGMMVKEGVLEVKCDSRFCGHGPGVVVLHRFDVTTGELLETKSFKNPGTERSTQNADFDDTAALRSA
jgi:hypothetical protein